MKKRSKSQRTGTSGETEFRRFAGRHRLIPNKVEEDFGTDFLCQVEGLPNYAGVAEVLGPVVGAFVRATRGRRGRHKLNRNDAEHLLACNYPIAVVLVHFQGNQQTVYAQFVDGDLGHRLGDFLMSGNKHINISGTSLKPESDFDSQLRRACSYGFVEQVRVSLAASRVSSVIPSTKIEVRRSDRGASTLVRVHSFLAQYDEETSSKQAIYRAVFGHEAQFRKRLGAVPLRKGLLEALRHLPSPIVIGGPVEAGDAVLAVLGEGGDGDVECPFEVRVSPGHTGWVHESGFALTLSESTKHEGQWVHFLRAHADADVTTHLEDYAELWDFLVACQPNAKLRLASTDQHTFTVEMFEQLPMYGFFARFLKTLSRIHKWPRGTWLLSDGADEEVLVTLEMLATLATAPNKLRNFGFTLSPDYETLQEESSDLWVPLAMNLPRVCVVAWVRTVGILLRAANGDLLGFRFGDVTGVRLDLRDGRLDKGRLPEIVLHPDSQTVPLATIQEELNQPSNPKDWACGFLPADEDEPAILGEMIELPCCAEDLNGKDKDNQ